MALRPFVTRLRTLLAVVPGNSTLRLEGHHDNLVSVERLRVRLAEFLAEVRDRHPLGALVVGLLLERRAALQHHGFVGRLLGVDDQRHARIAHQAFVFERFRAGMKSNLPLVVLVPGRHRMRRSVGRSDGDHRDVRLLEHFLDIFFPHRHVKVSPEDAIPDSLRIYFPANVGLRFSRNARVPSRTSSEGFVIITLSAASSSAFSSVISRYLYIMRFASLIASGGPSASRRAKSFTRASSSACGTTSVTSPSSSAVLAS